MKDERCLKTILNDKQPSFGQLLNQENTVSIPHRNIQTLAIEICKTVHLIAPEIIQKVFKLREESHYNLRQTS